MTDHPPNESFDNQRRELELELVKIRSEANAARLEARAAELELMLRRMGGNAASEPYSTPTTDERSTVRLDRGDPAINPPTNSSVGSTAFSASDSPHRSVQVDPVQVFSSWDDVRAATESNFSSITLPTQTAPLAPKHEGSLRFDAPSGSVAAPHFPIREPEELYESDSQTQSKIQPNVDKTTTPKSKPSRGLGLVTENTAVGPEQVNDAFDDLEVDEEEQKRKSPAALVVSTLVHVGILVLLAAFSLGSQKPKDQVALSASVTEVSEVSMETFQIETNEPQTEPTDPTNETAYELSPVGKMAIAEIKPEAPPAPPTTDSTSLLQSTSAAAMSVKSDSNAKIQFCGVEGGGNHFVYLVDSSGSMGDGFESARSELLNSIDVLKPDQRFYVVFFDAEPDYMRLSDPNTDEPRSVYATPENKQALKRWAMQIRKDRGRAPYDPLKFALKLEADVIFLLSDGEFPQGIEDLLKENNRVDNLFGDAGPISIVHTIGYFSREGETRMRRIAEQNDGQYRHVPKP